MDYKNWTEEQETALDEVMDAVLERAFKRHRRPVKRTRESLERAHEKLGLPTLEPAGPVDHAGNVRARRRVAFSRAPARIAAAVAVTIALGGVAVWMTARMNTTLAPERGTMVEVAGEKGQEVTLPDGSVVRPVGESRVTMAADFEKHRHVILDGEAFFSVAHDDRKPFCVETENLKLTVLGTEFNLKDYALENETVVSLVSGSVKIDHSAQEESIVLAPMERMVLDKTTGQSAVSSFTPEQIERWRSGRRTIDNMTLEQALVAVGDFYDKNVEIKGTTPAASVSTTLTENATLESTLEAVRLVNDVFEYEIAGRTIYITFK